jgi:hypothetical protein
LELSGLKFRAISSDEIYMKKVEEIFTIDGLSSKINFRGAHVVKKMKAKELKRYIKIGSMTLDMHEAGG